MQFSNKLSTAGIGLDKKTLLGVVAKAKGKAVPVCRFVGQASDMQPGEGQNGTWLKFKGLFAGINYLTGEEIRSGACFLPTIVSDMVEGMVAKAKGEDGTGAVAFAFEITVKADATAAVGYVFGANSLVKGDDPLAALMNDLPALPKPKA